jgi:ADP-dependent NAD(P)H-hydrate dehydratase / NAD(P)H-hydrate epimerase
VHVHGAAADALVKDGIGPVGLTASEVIERARALWNLWLGADQPR